MKQYQVNRACHEAGHAFIAVAEEPNLSLLEVSIRPSFGPGFIITGGGTKISSEEETDNYNVLISKIKHKLAGYLAEKIILGKVSPGSDIDFKEAWLLSCRYLQMKYPERKINPDDPPEKNKEACALLERLMEDTAKIVKDHRSEIKTIAEKLLEKKTLSGKEVREIIKNASR